MGARKLSRILRDDEVRTRRFESATFHVEVAFNSSGNAIGSTTNEDLIGIPGAGACAKIVRMKVRRKLQCKEISDLVPD